MKKALALLLALVMTLALASCGKKDGEIGIDPGPSNTTEPAATPDNTPAEPAGDADYSGYTIRIYSN